MTEEHLSATDGDQRAFLAQFLGTPICGVARAAGLTNLDTDNSYMPSVPFISLQAACLAVGRLLAAQLHRSPAGNFVQYDGLFGPQAATAETFKSRIDCVCVTRSGVIDLVRQERARSTVVHGQSV